MNSPAHSRYSDLLVRTPAAGHRAHWQGLRSSHARLVPDRRRCWTLPALYHHPGVFVALNPLLWPPLSLLGRCDELSCAWLRLSLRDRRRGALRRYGRLRSEADLMCLDGARLLKPYPQLRRSGCARSRRRTDRQQYLLSPLPRFAGHAAGHPCNLRDDYRQPVDHHRSVFDDKASDTARLAPTPHDQTDVCGGVWANLRGRSIGCS